MTSLPIGAVRSMPKNNPRLDLPRVPPTDVSMASYRMVPIQAFTTGINPVVFQIDPQTDYVDLSRSNFEMEFSLKKGNGGNLAAAENMYPANNLAHTMFKQIIVKFNNTLMSPSTDTYHYKAYLETLTNYNGSDGETILRPQGWYNVIDQSATWTSAKLDSGGPDAAYNALSATQKEAVLTMKKEIAKYAGGATHILRFKPHLEVFHLNKLLVPEVQIDIQMYFNSPTVFMNGIPPLTVRLHQDDVKIKFYLCQVRLNPSTYRSLAIEHPAMYPTVRGEIRTYSISDAVTRFECNNVFQGRIPNRVMVGIVLQSAFTGAYDNDPFAFQKFALTNIRQIVNGEEYPYETLELNHNNGQKDMRGYSRFLQASSAQCKMEGNMVRDLEWGQGKNCTLFVFDNAANGCLDSPVMNPKQSGELQLILNFGQQTDAHLTLIVYGEFENMIEITRNKAVIYDIYER